MSNEETKNFEKNIKEYIVSKFKDSLNDNLINKVQEKDYSSNINNSEDINVVKSNIIRNILDDLISVTCVLDYEITPGNFVKLEYGRALEDGLIENYALEIAKNNGVDFKINPNTKENLAMALEIYRSIDNKLDYMAFNNDAVDILEFANIDDVTEYFDKMSLDTLKEPKKEITPKEKALTSEVKLVNEEKPIHNEGTIQIVFIDGKRTVKYIDDKEHILNVNDDYNVSDKYRKSFALNKKKETVSSKIVFDELRSVFGEKTDSIEEKLEKTDVVDIDEIAEAQKEDIVINPIVETKDEYPYEELTPEKVAELKQKAQSNTITIDELRELRRALSLEANKLESIKKDDVDLMNTVELENLNKELQKKKEMYEELTANNKGDKKTNWALYFFIFCVVLSISIIVGVILAYYK